CLTWSTWFSGIVILSIGLLFAGLSAWLVVRALPDSPVEVKHFPVLLATISLATVGGFVSLLPGGIGVRELVIIPLLSPIVGTPLAVAAAILIRVCWMMAELVTSGTIEILFRFAGFSKVESAR
ncbi:MAG: hypothetical protein R3C03_24340, partial [Pirellulaceae bacterium]